MDEDQLNEEVQQLAAEHPLLPPAIYVDLRKQALARSRSIIVLVDNNTLLDFRLRDESEDEVDIGEWLSPPPPVLPAGSCAAFALGSCAVLSGVSSLLRFESLTETTMPPIAPQSSSASLSEHFILSLSKPYFGQSKFYSTTTPRICAFSGAKMLQEAHSIISIRLENERKQKSPSPSTSLSTSSSLASSAAAASSLTTSFNFDSFESIMQNLYYALDRPMLEDYIIEQLYTTSEQEQVLFYLPQLCIVALQSDAMEKYLLYQCSKHVDVSLRTLYFLQSLMQSGGDEEEEERKRRDSESRSVVNTQQAAAAATTTTATATTTTRATASANSSSTPTTTASSHRLLSNNDFSSSSPTTSGISSEDLLRTSSTGGVRKQADDAALRCKAARLLATIEPLHPQIRSTLSFIQVLIDISTMLTLTTGTVERNALLQSRLRSLPPTLSSIALPLTPSSTQLLRIPATEAYTISSRARVPFVMFFEIDTKGKEVKLNELPPRLKQAIVDDDDDDNDDDGDDVGGGGDDDGEVQNALKSASTNSENNNNNHHHHRETSPIITLKELEREKIQAKMMSDVQRLAAAAGSNFEADLADDETDAITIIANRKTDFVAGSATEEEEAMLMPTAMAAAAATTTTTTTTSSSQPSTASTTTASNDNNDNKSSIKIRNDEIDEFVELTAATSSLSIQERWADRCDRIRTTSPFYSCEHWQLLSMIFKSNDDLRAEQLAIQLIKQFDDVFSNARLPLWLKPYQVLATSARSGIIELVPDSISIDSMKKRLPHIRSLKEYYVAMHGSEGGRSFRAAQRNFVESLAAYSLVCYFLQIKDRHNGNVMIGRDGHLIHIDYGFFLSRAPGSLNFENAPFKLTYEYVELMGGATGDAYHYFKTLFVRGFIEARREYRRLLLPVRLMLPVGARHLSCFSTSDGHGELEAFRNRFQLQLNEDEIIDYALMLVNDSLSNWNTMFYDKFQALSNSIKE